MAFGQEVFCLSFCFSCGTWRKNRKSELNVGSKWRMPDSINCKIFFCGFCHLGCKNRCDPNVWQKNVLALHWCASWEVIGLLLLALIGIKHSYCFSEQKHKMNVSILTLESNPSIQQTSCWQHCMGDHSRIEISSWIKGILLLIQKNSTNVCLSMCVFSILITVS